MSCYRVRVSAGPRTVWPVIVAASPTVARERADHVGRQLLRAESVVVREPVLLHDSDHRRAA